jgi:hypothetical protein
VGENDALILNQRGGSHLDQLFLCQRHFFQGPRWTEICAESALVLAVRDLVIQVGLQEAARPVTDNGRLEYTRRTLGNAEPAGGAGCMEPDQ